MFTQEQHSRNGLLIPLSINYTQSISFRVILPHNSPVQEIQCDCTVISQQQCTAEVFTEVKIHLTKYVST